MYIIYIYIYIYLYILNVLNKTCVASSSKVLNTVNRVIYLYFGFSTKTTIIDHYIVFHGLIPILR